MHKLDKALYYLAESEYYKNRIEPITIDDYIFSEAGDEKQEENSKATKGFIESIKKVIDSIVEALKNLIENIANFFKGEYFSSEHKEKIKEIKKVISQNPEVGNMKVEGFVDFNEYEKDFSDAEKELEKEYNKKGDVDKKKVDDIFTRLNNKLEIIKNKFTETGKAAASHYTLSTAVDIADRNVSLAKAMNFLIKNDIVELDGIRKTLGDDVVDAAEDKIEYYSKAGWLHRLKLKLRMKKYNTMKGVMMKQVGALSKFTNVKWWKGLTTGRKDLIDIDSIARGAGSSGGKKLFGKAADDVKVAADVAIAARDVAKDVKSFFN